MTSYNKLIIVVGIAFLALPSVLRAEEPILSCLNEFECGEPEVCDSLFPDCCSDECCDGLFERLGLDFSVYMQQSINTNSRNPTNPPAGAGNWPGAGWTYRNDEYMFNRLYLTLLRKPNTENGQWGIGGEVDVLYGTDYQFLQSRGLETHNDNTNKWNSGQGSGLFGVGLMGVALPQAFLEVANENVSLKLGHFYHPLGFVRLDLSGAQIGNTGTYSLFYAEFLPVTGGMADIKVNDQMTITAGLHRGNGNWSDNNDKINGFGGVNWISEDGNTLIMYKGDVGAEDNAGINDQYIQSIVFERKFCERWAYIFQSDYGFVRNGVPGGGDANFYSIINMVGVQVNEKLHGGIRYELFDDVDGTRVVPAPGPGIWNAIAVGGTYKIHENLWLRPELRWDWFDADSGVGPGPFKNGTERSRFLASFSVFMFL